MDTLDYLHSIKTENDTANASMPTIAINTSLSFKQVRTQLKNLIKDGYIEQLTQSTYQITNKIRASAPEIDITRTFYCEFVSERTGKTINPKYHFVCYDKTFRSIATMCRQEKMNIYTYIAACFDVFPISWCIKILNRPYPYPALLLNKNKARERYDIFMRQLMSYAPVEIQAPPTIEQKLEPSYYVWKRLKLNYNIELIRQYIEIGLISKLFFIALPCHDNAFISANTSDLKICEIKEARKILKEWINK